MDHPLVAGTSEIICASAVAGATQSFICEPECYIFCGINFLVLKHWIKVQLSTDRKGNYDWLTTSERQWPVSY